MSATPSSSAGSAPAPLEDLLAGFPPPRDVDVDVLAAAVAAGRRLVVLDDDPTGTQSTTDLPVVTTTDAEDLRWGLRQPTPGFFVLTNSRSLAPADATELLHRIVSTLLAVAAEEGVEVVVASRGDSTLRGHFPLETDVVTQALTAAGRTVDGVVVVPALVDAGRVTVDSVHLLRTPEGYVPVGESEFARDATFGYAASDLRDWVVEKTGGRVAREDVVALTLADLRATPERVLEVLDSLRGGAFLVADAAADEDLRALVEGLLAAEARGREFVYRTGPSFVRARTGQVATPPVTPGHLRAALPDVADERPRSRSGLVVVGSHVGLTTRQLDTLRAAGGIVEVELEVPTLVQPAERDAHVRATVERVVRLLDEGGPDVVVRTSRTLVRGSDADDSLRIARAVSGALVEVVHEAVARTRPAFVLAKGGITSSDTATKALGITRAYSRGTLLPGLVSVWEPVVGTARGVAYVVFAGNVGDENGVLDAVTTLRAAARPVVALVGTLDTKGAEYAWTAARLAELGVLVHVVDVGTHEPRDFPGPIATPAEAVARAGGSDLAALRRAGDRGAAVTAAGEGAAVVLAELERTGRLDGVLALGGSGGSAIAARAVRDLRLGLPKLIVSTMASGDVTPYVGASDVSLTYSVVDIAGINRLSRLVMGNAAAAIAGMAAAHAAAPVAAPGERPLVAASMFGVTTPAVDAARERLEQLGYEVLVFHATGAGGRALENLARSRVLAGVLDLTTTELADDLVGGVLSAGPARLTAAGAAGVPQVVSLGALDMVNFGPRDTVPAAFADRTFFEHNATVTLMRTTVAENAELGRRVGEKLAGAGAPTVLLLPRGGVSALDAPGQPFADADADGALFDAVTRAVAGSAVRVVESERNINDREFAERAADELHALITSGKDQTWNER